MIQSILIVSSAEKSLSFFQDILSQTQYEEITAVKTCGEARRLLIERTFDLCIINAPLCDEFGQTFATSIIEEKVNQVILIVRDELYDEISSKVEECGVLTISKPVSRAVFWTALKLANASFNKLHRLKNENSNLNRKIEDISIVNRAKLVLIDYLGMSEEQAHKHIEKQAMDMRTTRANIARNILKTYES
ncbi:MAG: ANTAR domain-containing protein [Clostridia bacterium]|nr:ANTAR domain-containing protein [Clostridia bacterium]